MANGCFGSSLKNSVQNTFSLLNRADDESDYVAELFLKKNKKTHTHTERTPGPYNTGYF